MNKSIIAAILGLVGGAAVGYIVARVQCEKKRDEDIELALKNYRMELYAKQEQEKKDADILVKAEEKIEDAKEVVKATVTSLGYFEPEGTVEEKEDDIVRKPMERSVRYISPSELDDGGTDYEVVRYTWNKDGSLKREDDDNPITDIDEIIDEVGLDFRDKFKDMNVEAVYIRDDTLEYDYVIERNLLNVW